MLNRQHILSLPFESISEIGIRQAIKKLRSVPTAAEYNLRIAKERYYLALTRRRAITSPASPKPTSAIVAGSGTNSILSTVKLNPLATVTRIHADLEESYRCATRDSRLLRCAKRSGFRDCLIRRVIHIPCILVRNDPVHWETRN